MTVEYVVKSMIKKVEKLMVATGNEKKAKEIEGICGIPAECVKLDIPEIQSLDVVEVARAKAAAAYTEVKAPVVVDDTGISVDALGGLPGALVSWFLDTIGPSGIVKLMADQQNRTAIVSTAIGYADENGVHVFVGKVEGTISKSLRWDQGFGYDPIFIPNGSIRTYAEMSAEEKNSQSMRKIALDQLRDFLGGRG